MDGKLLRVSTDILEDAGCTDILKRMEARRIFHDNREMALASPELARDKLQPYATLKINVVQAKKLIAADSPWYNSLTTSKGSSDPYAMIFVDDEESGHTHTINGCCDPVWDSTATLTDMGKSTGEWYCDGTKKNGACAGGIKDEQPAPDGMRRFRDESGDFDICVACYEVAQRENQLSIPIDTANSIVQVQVLDEDTMGGDDLLGFCEFPVSDLPVDGRTITGWFDLTPKGRLQGTCKDRVAKALVGKDIDGTQESGDTVHEEGKAGYVYISMKLEIVSHDTQDELYAFCLPDPTFKVWPKSGFKRSHEPLDAQGLYDALQLLQSSLLDGFVRPVMTFHKYILTWREKWLSAVVCFFACIVAAEPLYLGFCLFFVWGLFLILLKDPVRRQRMGADANNAPLTQQGYELMAWVGSGEQMKVFLERIIEAMSGSVLNQKRLGEFAAFSFDSQGVPVTTYADLKAQLRRAGDIDDPEKRFVEFSSEPLAADSLVTDQAGNVGVVKKCKNPKDPPEKWRYSVAFGDGKEPIMEDRMGDELSERLSLRWVSNQAVLALIPNSLEDTIMNLQPIVDNLGRQIQSGAFKIHSIIAWEVSAPVPTFYIVGALFILSAIFFVIARFGSVIWILLLLFKLVFIGVVIAVHIYGADFMVRHRVKVHADQDVEKHKAKDPKTVWAKFFRADQ